MRRKYLIALVTAALFLVAAIGAGPLLAKERSSPELRGAFSKIDDYFLQRFSQSVSTRLSPNGASAEPESAPAEWASSEPAGRVEALSLHYAAEDGLSLAAGKYTPAFGVSASLAPLSMAAEISREFDQKGRLGLGAAWQFAGAGQHRLSLDSFFAESDLLNPATWRADGPEKANEGRYLSEVQHFSAVLNGEFQAAFDGLSYQIAIHYQESSDENMVQEYGYAAALHGEFIEAENFALHPVLEIAGLEDRGDAPLDRRYLTLGVTGEQGPWNLSLTYSGRNAEVSAEPEETSDDNMLHLSLRHATEDGTVTEFGHRLDSSAGGSIVQNLTFRVSWPL